MISIEERAREARAFYDALCTHGAGGCRLCFERAVRGATISAIREATAPIAKALEIACKNGTTDGSHHKMWVIDQMVRALTDCPVVDKNAVDSRGAPYTYKGMTESEEYKKWVAEAKNGPEGPDTYDWDTGIAP